MQVIFCKIVFCDSLRISFQNIFCAAYLLYSANFVLTYVHTPGPVPWQDPIPRPSEIMKVSTTRDWMNTYVYPRRSIPFLKYFFTIQSYQNIHSSANLVLAYIRTDAPVLWYDSLWHVLAPDPRPSTTTRNE